MFVDEIRVLQKSIELINDNRNGVFSKADLNEKIYVHGYDEYMKDGFIMLQTSDENMYTFLNCSNLNKLQLLGDKLLLVCRNRVLEFIENGNTITVVLDDIKNTTQDEKFNLKVLYSEKILKYINILLSLEFSNYEVLRININSFEKNFSAIQRIIDGINIERIWGDK